MPSILGLATWGSRCSLKRYNLNALKVTMDFVKQLQLLGERFAARRADAVAQLGDDLVAIKNSRVNQDEIELLRSAYIEVEEENDRLRAYLYAIHSFAANALELNKENSDA